MFLITAPICCILHTEHMFSVREGGVHIMKKDEIVKIINGLLEYLDETDITFLSQIYTLIKKHIERKRRH